MMAIFDVDFVFSCPCFVPSVLNAIERSTKNVEIGSFLARNYMVKNFKVNNSKK